MDRYIKDFIGDLFDIDIEHEYLFGEVCGFTFVFRRDITFIDEQVSSAEIEPVGIIYEENDEYYYVPLYGTDEIDGIIQEFVKRI